MSGPSDQPHSPGRVTIGDVARLAGVSIPTVSKAINGRYGVAPATLKRVLSVVDELGYETSIVASSLRRQRTNVLGILVAEFEPFSVELLKGASTASSEKGYELLAYSSLSRGKSAIGWERRSLSRLAGTLIDGAIIVTPTVLAPIESIPVVMIDPHTGQEGSATINSDSFGGAQIATQHLIDLGHRNIAHIRGRGDLISARLREDGYRDALLRAGLQPRPENVRDGGYQFRQSAQATQELLTLTDRPTAIFAANDMSALGAMSAAQELGLTVPRDLSIVGFDDIPEARSSTPPLTTLVQPLQEIGVRAVHMLSDLLEGEDPPQPTYLSARLVVRGSTAPPPDLY
ncbi:LacI family DNA-binding transcriptional regulator [Lysinibacter sp. HNR]|uniref:LacI family DNA-binding transcriptional regulator n=1 Tax=Lysinibacter sp. HNR TaxID=3031408 RepID=UPI0024347D07|nr:LacI family DNA-binding transcriptional regulator [Lysinibacter sp. HNR]WGD37716.1 LacI family DNA-binding transcriptional regulator [Lysinibacter sp. HNR]